MRGTVTHLPAADTNQSVNANDRAITALVMLAHGLVHTYEMAVPIFVVICSPSLTSSTSVSPSST